MSAAFDAAAYLREQRRRTARLYGTGLTVRATSEAKRLMREAKAERDMERELAKAERDREYELKVAALEARRDAAIAFLSGNEPTPAKEIIKAVAEKYGFQYSDLVSARRNADIVYARWEAMWLISEKTSMSYTRIGRLFGRDHTTVMHGVHAYALRNGLMVHHSVVNADGDKVTTITPPRKRATERFAKPVWRGIIPTINHRSFNVALDEEIARCKALDAARAKKRR